jgi:cupin 2 domain-containing protein
MLEGVMVDDRLAPRHCRLEEQPSRPSAGVANLLGDVPAAASEETVETLVSASDIRIERIVSHGHASPAGFWYDQPTHEWVLVIAGAARLQFEGEAPFELRAGSHVSIPAHRRHRVDWTDPDQATIWLAVHYGARP